MTGVLIGAAITAAAWAIYRWDQQRILRALDRRADDRIDEVWEAFYAGDWRVR